MPIQWQDIVTDAISLRRELHKNPELGWQETRTAGANAPIQAPSPGSTNTAKAATSHCGATSMPCLSPKKPILTGLLELPAVCMPAGTTVTQPRSSPARVGSKRTKGSCPGLSRSSFNLQKRVGMAPVK